MSSFTPLFQEKITEFLYTFQEPNYALLLELIAGAQAIKECANEVLLVYFFSRESSTQLRAKTLLESLEIAALHQTLVASALDLEARYCTTEEQEALHQAVIQLGTLPFISIGTIATALMAHNNRALCLAIDYSPPKQQRALIDRTLNGNRIFYLNKSQSLEAFPLALLDVQALTHLTFFIRSQRLESGVLLPNDSFVLPKELSRLQQLKALHLYGAPVHSFSITAFQQLPALRSLRFSTTQVVDVDALQRALPQCQLNISSV